MPNLRQLLSAALALGLLVHPVTAEARFGKRPSSDSSGKTHDASPVGSDDDDDDNSSSGSHGSRGSSSSVNAVSTLLDVLFFVADTSARASRYETTVYVNTSSDEDVSSVPPPSVEVQQRPEPVAGNHNRLMFRLGVDGQALGDGAAVGLNLGLEGKRWGVSADVSSLTLLTDDGTQGEDKLGLYAAHLTYALYTSHRGRLRAELGVAGAKAPDITFVGPSAGLSFEHCLFGALDVEARGQLVPVPHLQLESQAGLAVHLGVLTLRGGWRVLLLDDRGLAGGGSHRDVLSGPYAGLGLNI
ncbi:hypothetical protein [Vitiosangium sp. GDMCC 1.1324]|uniref:hypothetical protein n=1 Tax=Vitiosangium sp. (strain GDMCC 1.1324) TaxID=2138576 RepID=UPI000D3D9CF5|nr:hypothetical protein [Vitiosangium sp. GDMCC 1.1324]PTL83268.1 hypothetical protein DAT35_14860 [Vitiosangium sp. GDMCC 1.1324]